MPSKSQQLMTLLIEHGPTGREELQILTGWTPTSVKNTLIYLNKVGKIQREGEIISAHPNPPLPTPRKAYPAQPADPEQAEWLADVQRQIAEKQQRRAFDHARESRL